MTTLINRSPSKKTFLEITEFSDLVLPEKTEQVRFISSQARSAVDFIDLIIGRFKNIEEIIICNSTINDKSLNRIMDIHENHRNIKFSMVIRSTIKARKPEIIKLFLDQNKNGIKCKLAYVHTKVILIKADANYFVLEGSGNISTNDIIEQYSLSNCKESYNFHKKWITDIFNTEEIKEIQIDKDALLLSVVESLKEIGVKRKTLKRVLDNIDLRYNRKINQKEIK